MIFYKDVIGDLKDCDDVKNMTKSIVTDILKKLCDNMLLAKDFVERNWYKIEKDLSLFINEKFGVIQEDFGCTSSIRNEDDTETCSNSSPYLIENGVRIEEGSHDNVFSVVDGNTKISLSSQDDVQSLSSVSIDTYTNHSCETQSTKYSLSTHKDTVASNSSFKKITFRTKQASFKRKQQEQNGSKLKVHKNLSQSRFFSKNEFTSIDDIHKISPDEDTMTKCLIVQPKLNRIIYYAGENQTIKSIAETFRIDVRRIVADNKRRTELSTLTQKAKLRKHTPIILPFASSHFENMSMRKNALMDVEDIYQVNEDDDTMEGAYVIQPGRRIIYYARDNETPSKIASHFKLDVNELILDNKRRVGYKSLKKDSKLMVNSPILLPL